MVSVKTVAASFRRSKSLAAAESGDTVKGEMAAIETTAVVANKDRNLSIVTSLGMEHLKYHGKVPSPAAWE